MTEAHRLSPGGASPRATLTISEKQFQSLVTDLLRAHRWRVYHTRDSRGSEAGFPDIVAVSARRILAAELKTESGRVSAAQQQWLDDLVRAIGAESKHRGGSWCAFGERVVVGLFRPSAFDWLEWIARGARP